MVVDPGTDSIKAGFAGQEHPAIEIPSIVGHPRVYISRSSLCIVEFIYCTCDKITFRTIIM